ncbi:MAG: hypothetical protein V1659_05870 [Candidatus Woesearchaeota archaeon]
MDAFNLKITKDSGSEPSGQAGSEKFVYDTVEGMSYSSALVNLRAACDSAESRGLVVVQPCFTLPDGSSVYRPLSFGENFFARVDNYKSNGANGLFRVFLDSCSGAVRADKHCFKLVDVCGGLVGLSAGFDGAFLGVGVQNLDGVVLDTRVGVYDAPLSEEQAVDHPFYRWAAKDDKPLVREHHKIACSLSGREKVMGVYLRGASGELRALGSYYVSGSCGSCSSGSLNYYLRGAHFVRVAQRAAPTDVEARENETATAQRILAPTPKDLAIALSGKFPIINRRTLEREIEAVYEKTQRR